jgi:NADPH2:quinone reductase
MNLPLLKNFAVVGVFSGAWDDKEREAARLAKETLMEWVAEGKIRPHVGLVLPLERIGDAMAAIGARCSTGRVVMTVRGDSPGQRVAT